MSTIKKILFSLLFLFSLSFVSATESCFDRKIYAQDFAGSGDDLAKVWNRNGQVLHSQFQRNDDYIAWDRSVDVRVKSGDIIEHQFLGKGVAAKVKVFILNASKHKIKEVTFTHKLIKETITEDGFLRFPKNRIAHEYNSLRIKSAGCFTQCNDREDNDNDGLVDLDDPGCVDPSDNTEDEELVECVEGKEKIIDWSDTLYLTSKVKRSEKGKWERSAEFVDLSPAVKVFEPLRNKEYKMQSALHIAEDGLLTFKNKMRDGGLVLLQKPSKEVVVIQGLDSAFYCPGGDDSACIYSREGVLLYNFAVTSHGTRSYDKVLLHSKYVGECDDKHITDIRNGVRQYCGFAETQIEVKKGDTLYFKGEDSNELAGSGIELYEYCDSTPSVKQCNDGEDNDGDGLIDDLDPGCSDPLDDNEGDEQLSASLSCFSEIIEGHEQICSIFVTAGSSQVSDAQVNVYYSNGDFFGSCETDALSGGCDVSRVENSAGSYAVYAQASRVGSIGDLDTVPLFSYGVLEEKYDIINLKLYNDSQFNNEDNLFFRGEKLYVQFEAAKISDGSAANGLISRATLVSPPGGSAALELIDNSAGIYRYQLTPIPATHDFLGTSQVFTFVFNFSDGSGGQEQVDLTILNNPPQIVGRISDQILLEGESKTIDLSAYEYDLEDSDEDLLWGVSGVFPSPVGVSLQDKLLTLKGLSPGSDIMTLSLTDRNGDSDFQQVSVEVAAVACFDNTDCNDNNASTTDSCINAGTANAYCFNTPLINDTILCTADAQCDDGDVFTEDICENPGTVDSQCNNLPIACFVDTECGVDSFTGDTFCKDDNVHQNFVTYSCSEAGSSSASCSDSLTPTMVEPCEYGCANGACNDGPVIECFSDSDCEDGNSLTLDRCENPGATTSHCIHESLSCLSNSDCGADGFVGDSFCQGNDVYQSYESHTCSGSGLSSQCSSTLTPTRTQACPFGCELGSCTDQPAITCYQNEDCGSPTYFGNAFCRSDDLHQQFSFFTCEQAGTPQSHCVEHVDDAIVQSCAHGCSNNQCISTKRKTLLDSDLHISDISLGRVDRFVLDDQLEFGITLRNTGDRDLDDLSVDALIYDLGLYYPLGSFDLDDGDSITLRERFDLPFSAASGWYDVRVVVSNDAIRRVIHREVEIK